jgi:signal transduction histidine kinase
MPTRAESSLPGRILPVAVLALTILVFGTVVAIVTAQQEAGLREQILRRQAEILGSVASLQLDVSALELGEEVANVPGALLVAVLKASKFRGVVGVSVFDANGTFNASDNIYGAAPGLPPAQWQQLARGEPIVRMRTRMRQGEVEFVQPVAADAELLEAWVPLRRSSSPALIGAAQFWLEGAPTRAELDAADRELWLRAGSAWLGGSLVLVVALGWMFRRLAQANRELRMRSEDLQRANRELVLAAKTSALGTVTAHLMHELKNPIAGLETLVAGQGEAGGREAGGELAAASELTRRLRTMVNDVVGVLRDEQTGAEFELSAEDVVEIVTAKVRDDAAARGVMLDVKGATDAMVTGRRGNLATLVLRNLVQNAIEASPAGGVVRVHADKNADGSVAFTVEDSGGGLAPAVRARLFQPCASTKVGGSGLGLALSHQIAQQAGGRLELLRSDERGTGFRLVLAPEA